MKIMHGGEGPNKGGRSIKSRGKKVWMEGRKIRLQNEGGSNEINDHHKWMKPVCKLKAEKRITQHKIAQWKSAKQWMNGLGPRGEWAILEVNQSSRQCAQLYIFVHIFIFIVAVMCPEGTKPPVSP